MREEIWKQIEGFPSYEVSNNGEIRHVDTKNPVVPWVCNEGYVKVELKKENKAFKRGVHRLVAMAFCGVGENDFTNHLDKNTQNNKAENLERCSNRENVSYSSSKKLKYAYRNGKNKKWRSSCWFMGKIHHFGYHETELEAHTVAVKFLEENGIVNKYASGRS